MFIYKQIQLQNLWARDRIWFQSVLVCRLSSICNQSCIDPFDMMSLSTRQIGQLGDDALPPPLVSIFQLSGSEVKHMRIYLQHLVKLSKYNLLTNNSHIMTYS